MAELLRTTSARELREWEMFERLEPWGDEWRQTGMQIAAVYNAQRASKDDPILAAEDVLGNLLPPREPLDDADQPPEQSIDELNAIFSAGGATVITKPATDH